MQLHAIDLDQKNTSNSKVTMKMVSQSPDEPKISLKQLDGRVAQLTFSGCFSYDVRPDPTSALSSTSTCELIISQLFQKIKKYKVIVMAHDHGTPMLSSSATININVLDSNSHPPMFKRKEASTVCGVALRRDGT